MGQDKSSVFGDLFDRVVVVNLSRREDRMSSLRGQLDMLGIRHTRFAAVDGRAPDVAAEWQAYSARALSPSPAAAPVRSWRDFYLGDRPHEARVAFFEAQRGRKAIASAGAWGLFMSMKGVLEEAVRDRVESLLILEDDVLFHRDTVDLWPVMRAELPDDWRILQLGAMQLHWEADWIEWHSEHLYRCNGSSIAAHAVALRADTIAEVLALCEQPDLPFDVGPLQEVKRRHREHCFTCYPNLAIQDAADSEIGMSKIFFREARKTRNIYRWTWSDYGPSVLRRFTGQFAPDASGFPEETGRTPSDPSSPLAGGPERKPLHPYAGQCPDAPRVLALVSETPHAPADAHLDLLARQRDRAVAAPIVVIDDLALVPKLRERKLAFEYVPSAEIYAGALPDEIAIDVAIMRRLALLRRKWTPARILAFGDAARARLDAWRASPFEANAPGPDLDPDYDASDTAIPAAP